LRACAGVSLNTLLPYLVGPSPLAAFATALGEMPEPQRSTARGATSSTALGELRGMAPVRLIRQKLRSASYTMGGQDWLRLFALYDANHDR
jgi:hypothetical protein